MSSSSESDDESWLKSVFREPSAEEREQWAVIREQDRLSQEAAAEDLREFREDPQWYMLKKAAKIEWAKRFGATSPDDSSVKPFSPGLECVRSPQSDLDGSKVPEETIKSILHPLVENRESTLHPLVKNAWQSVDPGSGCRRVKAIVDSGASNSVAAGSLAPEIPVVPSEGSKRGQTYAGAAKGGKPLHNEGEKVIPAFTSQGKPVSTTWQVVEVNRPLMSVHQICEKGNVVVFGEGGGYILSLADGTTTHTSVWKTTSMS